jgi:hypothetical protein
VHNCCTVLTFATVNRQSLLKKSAEELETELAKSPSKARAEVKRQVYHHGLDAPIVVIGAFGRPLLHLCCTAASSVPSLTT